MKYLPLAMMLSLLPFVKAATQGCIAVRNLNGFGQYLQSDNAFTTTNWVLNVNNRYFKSFKDYKGSKNLNSPVENQSVNHIFTTDIQADRFLRNGWSLSVGLPVSYSTRRTALEHGGPNTPKHTTSSFGIGDLRLVAYKWIRYPKLKQRFNLQVGLGLKFPTGDYKYQDYFYRNDTTKVLAPVNPSIQMGDGGTGIISEVNSFFFITKKLSLYGNFYYLLNPRNENGTPVTFGRTPSDLAVKAGAVYTSVPDQWAFRIGANLNIKKFSASLGVRDEGVPVYDLLGESTGVRRSGHNFSVEPGLIYKFKRMSVYTYVPIIVDRKTRQIVPDKNMTKLTGSYTLSPGGFADYLVFVGALFKL